MASVAVPSVLRTDGDQLRVAATRLRGQAASLNECARAIAASVRSAGAVWQGEAAGRFREVALPYAIDLQSGADCFSQVSSALDSLAATGDPLRREALGLQLEAARLPGTPSPAQAVRLMAIRKRLNSLERQAVIARGNASRSVRRAIEGATRYHREQYEHSFLGQVQVFLETGSEVLSEFFTGLVEGTVGLLIGVGTLAYVTLSITFGTINVDPIARRLAGELGQGIWHLVTHPGEVIPSLLQLDLLRENPARWLGRVTPDIVLAVIGIGEVSAAMRASRTAAAVSSAASSRGIEAAVRIAGTSADDFARAGLWSGKSANPLVRAVDHFERHSARLGITTFDDYITRARSFLVHPPPDTLTKLRPNGDLVRFSPGLDVFGILTKDGLIRTFYRPNPLARGFKTSLDYFMSQSGKMLQ